MRTCFDECCVSWNRRASFQMNKSSNLITSNALHFYPRGSYTIDLTWLFIWKVHRALMSTSEAIISFYISAVTDLFGTYDILSLPPLVVLCQNLRTLGYKHKKFFLKWTRVQAHIRFQPTLIREFSTLLSSAYRIYLSSRTVQALIQQEFLPRNYFMDYNSLRKLCSLFDNSYSIHRVAPCCHIMTRAETTDHLETSSQQL